MLQLTPEQRIVVTLLCAGLVLIALPLGESLFRKLPYDFREYGPTASITLGIACLVGAWTVSKVLKLRK